MADKNRKQNFITRLRLFWGTLAGIKTAVCIAGVIIIVLVAVHFVRSCSDSRVAVTVDDKINVTPSQIVSMKEIGEWEFLSIADEEMVDTMRRGFFSDDELIRIYYGTLRLGINMHKVGPQWIKAEGDSVTVTLPRIELLDEDFIDEARTQSFYESGKWSSSDLEAMYRRAYIQMKERSLTPENISTAEKNAVRQFSRMMKSMGYSKVRVEIEGPQI